MPATGPSPQTPLPVRTLLGGSPLPMVATQGPHHVLRYVNPAFCWLLGLDDDAIVGSRLSGLLRSASPAQTETDDGLGLLDLVYTTGTAEFAVDLAPAFGADSIQVLRCAVWPILGADDRPDGLLLQVSARPSRTARRAVDGVTPDDLREANERLLLAGLKAHEQAELETTLRNEAEAALSLRDEFIAIAAHELRTPVTGIKISAQLALRALSDANAEKQQTVEYLRGIVGGANRLVVLMNDLLDVSRMRSGELQLGITAVDLAGLVVRIARRYVETGDELHRVAIDVPSEPVVVAGDAGRLEQVLDNLLSNAFKYSPGGGEIRLSLQQAADGVRLTVTDAGIGLPPGQQDRIFEPFGRAANAKRRGVPGLGLGLHICRQIVAAHGGRLWADSEGEGQGMIVSMWLPWALAGFARPPREHASAG